MRSNKRNGPFLDSVTCIAVLPSLHRCGIKPASKQFCRTVLLTSQEQSQSQQHSCCDYAGVQSTAVAEITKHAYGPTNFLHSMFQLS